MVESHNLPDELGPLGNQTLVDALVDPIKAVAESILNGRNPVQLSVVGSHHRAIVTDKLFATVAEVSQRLLVQQAELLAVKHLALSSGCRKGNTTSNIRRHGKTSSSHLHI